VAYTQETPLDCGWVMLDQPRNWQGPKTKADKDELRRRGHALTDGMNMPLDKKIDYAVRVLERAQAQQLKWALSFSAGRDSTVVSHLAVDVLGWKLPHVMSNTRMEYPETLRQLGRWRAWLQERDVELHVVVPEKRPAEVWAEGLPLWSKEVMSKARQFQATGNAKHIDSRFVTQEIAGLIRRLTLAGVKLSDRCCDTLKKEPMAKWDEANGCGGHVTGVRCEESQARRLMYIQRGSLYDSARHGQWLCHPLTHWRTADVEAYLARHQIVVERSGRSGCATCAFGAHRDQLKGVESTLQRLARENPKMLATALDVWGYRKALDIAGISYQLFTPSADPGPG
jgi:3'-phosphoadenosine 5'-phosphosulfate sulfotransferase (PAPS reductase)/FAD synthetase